jgi:DNA-directed RNA polymerase subunit K/omega
MAAVEEEELREVEPEYRRLTPRIEGLTDYYALSLDRMLEDSSDRDRYKLVIEAAEKAREINAARIYYNLSSAFKPTKVALNEVQFGRVFESRSPRDMLVEEEVEEDAQEVQETQDVDD